MKNEILDEVWHNRDKFARQHNYDMHSMVVELQKMERQSDPKIVDRRKQLPNTHQAPLVNTDTLHLHDFFHFFYIFRIRPRNHRCLKPLRFCFRLSGLMV